MIDYEDAKGRAQSRDVGERRTLAKRRDVPAEILYYLAGDSDPETRENVAANESAPPHVLPALSRDSQLSVRRSMARRLGGLLPDLNVRDRAHTADVVLDSLQVLACDIATEVRATVSEAVCMLSDVPIDVLRQLASDPDIMVSRPVLMFSPGLSENDLLELTAKVADSQALEAIASREYLPSSVAAAVVDNGDEQAVGALLRNPSVQLREDVLDRVVSMAPNHQSWHRPLVHRPELTPHLVDRLTRFIAISLLDELRRRTDLDADTMAAISAGVRARLLRGRTTAVARDPDDDPHGSAAVKRWRAAQDSFTYRKDPTTLHGERAESYGAQHGGPTPAELADMSQRGLLSESVMQRRLARGDRSFVRAALAFRTGVSRAVVDNILESKSARAIVSLVWKAGYSADLATQVQMTLAGLGPAEAIGAYQESFALSSEDMQWQLDFFTSQSSETGVGS